ncbi:MAG TPA: hypothetical protein VK816_02005, partial [Jatrophihabitantaceae bacterium]|nr:hypothetical protein [Jatrophihabitantaceae bacterium]
NLVWIMLLATVHVLRSRYWPAWEVTVTVAIPLVVIALIALIASDGATRKKAVAAAEAEEAELRLGPTFPIPPLNLVVPKAPAALAASRARASLPQADPDAPSAKGENADA